MVSVGCSIGVVDVKVMRLAGSGTMQHPNPKHNRDGKDLRRSIGWRSSTLLPTTTSHNSNTEARVLQSLVILPPLESLLGVDTRQLPSPLRHDPLMSRHLRPIALNHRL